MDDVRKYILIVFSILDAKEIHKKIEMIMVKGDKYNTVKINNFHIITFKSDKPLDELKNNIVDVYSPPPLFLIFDASERGVLFDLSFGKLESTILLEASSLLEEGEVIGIHENDIYEKENYDLNELLELVFKNGYQNLSDNQKTILKKYSDTQE